MVMQQGFPCTFQLKMQSVRHCSNTSLTLPIPHSVHAQLDRSIYMVRKLCCASAEVIIVGDAIVSVAAQGLTLNVELQCLIVTQVLGCAADT